MGYIKKEIRDRIVAMDKSFTVSSGVRKWLKTIEHSHNLIIKSKNNSCYCTNCHKSFNSSAKIGDVITCPKCKVELQIRKNTLQYQKFIDDFRVLDYAEGAFVLRGFELLSTYGDMKVQHDIKEYQRLVITRDKIILLLSNRFKNYLGYTSVAHYEKHVRWRVSDNYRWYMSRGMIYWGDIVSVLEGTPYQYCPISDVLLTHPANKDIEVLLQRVLINPMSFELLSKIGLTNLAIECHNFANKGSFEKRFGLTKDYLPFMVKHNITYHELEVLRVVKHKNITVVRKLSGLYNFEELSEYLDMEKALANGLNKQNEHLYRDYLDFAVRLNLNMKDKKVLYPHDITKAHDDLMHKVETVERKEIMENIKKRYEELKGNTYRNDKYIIFPIPTISDMKKESEVQDICIYKNYSARYADKECDLYFLRTVADPTKPLVAIEVRNNEIIQSRAKYNNPPSKIQMQFIAEWENKVLKGMSNYATI